MGWATGSYWEHITTATKSFSRPIISSKGPPASETLRMLIGTFLSLGVSEETVGKMVRGTPARILGWSEGDIKRVASERATALSNKVE